MATLIEMAKDIVAAHAQTTALTTDELIREIHLIHAVLQQLESGNSSPETHPADAASVVTTLTLKQAFKTNEVVCMICGKGGMKTLTRHQAVPVSQTVRHPEEPVPDVPQIRGDQKTDCRYHGSWRQPGKGAGCQEGCTAKRQGQEKIAPTPHQNLTPHTKENHQYEKTDCHHTGSITHGHRFRRRGYC
jgi:hypothetical protein